MSAHHDAYKQQQRIMPDCVRVTDASQTTLRWCIDQVMCHVDVATRKQLTRLALHIVLLQRHSNVAPQPDQLVALPCSVVNAARLSDVAANKPKVLLLVMVLLGESHLVRSHEQQCIKAMDVGATATAAAADAADPPLPRRNYIDVHWLGLLHVDAPELTLAPICYAGQTPFWNTGEHALLEDHHMVRVGDLVSTMYDAQRRLFSRLSSSFSLSSKTQSATGGGSSSNSNTVINKAPAGVCVTAEEAVDEPPLKQYCSTSPHVPPADAPPHMVLAPFAPLLAGDCVDVEEVRRLVLLRLDVLAAGALAPSSRGTVQMQQWLEYACAATTASNCCAQYLLWATAALCNEQPRRLLEQCEAQLWVYQYEQCDIGERIQMLEANGLSVNVIGGTTAIYDTWCAHVRQHVQSGVQLCAQRLDMRRSSDSGTECTYYSEALQSGRASLHDAAFRMLCDLKMCWLPVCQESECVDEV